MAFNPSRTQALSCLTAQYLRDNYLLGMRFVDESNNPYPDTFYDHKLNNAISQFEMHTTLTLLAREITAELHDYHSRDYNNFALIQLFHYPILSASPNYYTPQVTFVIGQTPVTTFPTDWVRCEHTRGQIHLLPSTGTISQVLLTMSGQYLPTLYGASGYVPQLFSVKYWAGFDPTKVPCVFIDCLAKMAAIEVLSIMGMTVYPPGVQSTSLGADGLSTSRSIMMSPDTAPVFSGLIRQYKNDIYGNPSQGLRGLFAEIEDYYRGLSMTVLG
jgi:hypothetical protein